jgi:coproporphyrinogen III oxidase-like Fe-S oxidoreductase
VDEALRALEIARNRFERVSCDLIYARQGQTPESWEAELSRALALGTDHLSLYQLTIEDGTAFGDRHRRGLLRGLPDEDRSVALFEMTQEMTAAAGLSAYEVSNHARPGQESRHNLIYWRGGDWAGVGPGAHGRLTHGDIRTATDTPRLPADWLAAVEAGTSQQSESLSAGDRASEYLLMSLRLTEGSDLDRYEVLGGTPLAGRLEDLEADGLLRRDGKTLFTTARGRLLLNSVLRALLA